MGLHADLLDQAEHLAKLDPRRPKQANLRRAISSAYYALFHLLAWEASTLYVSEPGLAARMIRTLTHRDMKRASSMIAKDKLPRGLQTPSGSHTTPAELKQVADTFVNLQQTRHDADYDLARTFRRREALDFVQAARQAFAAWEKVKRTDDARVYLASFQLWKTWDEERL